MIKKVILLFVALLVLAGCQTTDVLEPIDEAPGIPEDIVEVPELEEELVVSSIRVIEVEGYGRTFEPDTIEIELGETIEFVFSNTAGTHDFIIPSLGVGTEIIREGETDSFTHTFEEPGVFEFICSVGNHAAEGMVGQIIVS